MLPSLKQRVIILVAIVVGAWCWLMAEPTLLRADMGPGISLFYSRSGWLGAILYLVAAGLPALMLAMLASGAAHPLAGVFSVTFALAVVATAGGSIDGLLWQSQGPGVYPLLAVESVVWAALLVGMMVLIARSRLWVRRRFPRLTTEHHFGTATKLRWPGVDAMLTGVICASLSGLLCWVVLKSTDAGQVFGALVVGFMLGALIAYQIVSQPNPTAVLLSPCLVAVAAYGYTWWKLGSYESMMLALNSDTLPTLARALPMQYASAGVAGCVLGVTLAQAIEHARDGAAEAA